MQGQFFDKKEANRYSQINYDVFIKRVEMNYKRLSPGFLMAVSVFSLISLPQLTKAAESFDTTVKIVGYNYLLNGQIQAISVGSGTLISKTGEVLTNAHVIMNKALNKPLDTFSVCVSETPQNPPECRFTASLEQYDEKIDLAVLQIDHNPLWGNMPSDFPFLSYSHGEAPEENEPITVKGFPNIGGMTIHSTQGQISGFETWNGYNYLKIDAGIDAGNSGGTMLDEEGNFVGVPTYVVSAIEASGRVLNIKEVEQWLNNKSSLLGQKNIEATQKLSTEIQRNFQSNESGELSYKSNPKISVKIPEGWSYYYTNDTGFGSIKKDNDQAFFNVEISNELFEYKMPIEERMTLIRNLINDEGYVNEEITKIDGREAAHFWGEDLNHFFHMISVQYGPHVIYINYKVPKNEQAIVETDLTQFLESFTLNEVSQNDLNNTQTLDENNYPFSMKVPKNWRISKSKQGNWLLAFASSNETYHEALDVYYAELPQNINPGTPASGLNFELSNRLPEGSNVIFQSNQLIIDGLSGWIFAYEKKVNGIMMQYLAARIIDPVYEFYFNYSIEKDQFEEGVKDFKNILSSIESKRYQAIQPDWDDFIASDQKGVYNIPLPEIKHSQNNTNNSLNLSDIAGHRFEKNIKNLVERGVVNGYPDNTFKPEMSVNRAEALKIILESLRAMQIESGQAPFVMPTDFNAFPDVAPSAWFATYVAEGVEKGIVAGYPDKTFRGENNVILAEALKMALEAHSEASTIQVWVGETNPWHKKYIDAAYQFSLLPLGLDDPSKELTRAELAYIVDSLTERWPSQ